MKRIAALAATVGAVAIMGIAVAGSSHRRPRHHKTQSRWHDFYAFRSFEADVLITPFLANTAASVCLRGPNFTMDPMLSRNSSRNTGDAKNTDVPVQVREHL